MQDTKTNNLPSSIQEWLLSRGISQEVITSTNLGWDGQRLVIPILSLSGDFIFNKYRRDPLGPSVGPKYTYQAGSEAQLFNAHKLSTQNSVIICEGELDALALESKGYLAVSSTGGCGTFNDEWVPLFDNRDVYICFDNDKPGMAGAAKLLTKLNAKLVTIPEGVGKDVTDFLVAGGSFPVLLEEAKEFPWLSTAIPQTGKIKDLETNEKFLNAKVDELVIALRTARGSEKMMLEALADAGAKKVFDVQHEIKRKRMERKGISFEGEITEAHIARAKAVPVDGLLKFNRQRKGKCLWHDDSHPSLHWYPKQNVVKCFACGYRADAIDIVQKLHHLSWSEAVKRLLNV